MPTIVIQPDHVRHPNGEKQSFSDRWRARAAASGFDVRMVDVFAPNILEQLDGCHGFMWRFGYPPFPRLFAKRLLPAIEQGRGIPIYPTSRTAWHFEDKVSQGYLLEAAGVPTPRTWVFWREEDALEFVAQASYPLVLKLSYGFKSANVRLLRSATDAAFHVRQLFGPGVTSLSERVPRAQRLARRVRAAAGTLRGAPPFPDLRRSELHHGYVYLQEFLAGNTHDTRVTVIGDRAFAFRRRNRDDDFRASGSGRLEWDPSAIDHAFVRLAFHIARTLDLQTVAIDGLYRDGQHVINEISYTFASWCVRECPGHWCLPPGGDGSLVWVEGQVHPEDAIFDDFAEVVRRYAGG